MRDGGYDNSDARKAGCGCAIVGGAVILVGWTVIFGLSLGDCLQPDNIACHARAVREARITGVAVATGSVVALALIIPWYSRRR
jgi:hypothetical protein